MSQKVAGIYAQLLTALNKLEAAGEMPLFDERFTAVGLSATITRNEYGDWVVVAESGSPVR